MPSWIEYMGMLQQQQQARQQAAMQMQLFQQQQQDRQRQQAALAAAGNALPALFAGQQQAPQMPPPPQPPAPGQPSQPMQQASGGTTGIPALPPLPAKMPTGAAASTQAPGIPPFRPLPTSTSPAQASSGPPQIPQAPAPASPAASSGPLTLDGAIKALKDQGLSGADLMAGLQQLTPILDAQSKQQATAIQAQFNRELQIARLEEQYASIHQRAQDAADNRDLRRELAGQAQSARMELARFRLNANGANAVQSDTKLDPDTIDTMAEDYLTAPDPSIFTNLGRGRQGAANVVALREAIARKAKEQGMTGADLAARRIGVGGEKAAAHTAGTKATNVALATEEALQTFPLVREASASLPRTNMPKINQLLEAAQTGTGDPRWITLGTALNTAINAYAKAVSPSGTPTVSDKEHARSLLAEHLADGQINAALDIMQREMEAASNAPKRVMENQRTRITGARAAGPSVGTVEGGYRFKGGNPADPNSWEAVSSSGVPK